MTTILLDHDGTRQIILTKGMKELLKISAAERKKLRKWYKARSIFLGLDNYPRDFALGLELARRCDHPDAIKLYKLFPSGVGSDASVLCVFASYADDDPMYLGFWGNLMGDKRAVRRTAKLGFPLAMIQECMDSDYMNRTNTDEHIWKPLQCYEPDAIYLIADGYRLHDDISGLDQREREEFCFLLKLAADLGRGRTMHLYGKYQFDSDDPKRYYWWGKAARHKVRNPEWFFVSIESHLNQLVANMEWPASTLNICRRILYQLGRALEGHFNKAEGSIFEPGYLEPVHKLKLSEVTLNLYRSWRQQAIDAVNCWTLVGKRLGVAKDVIKMISVYLWAARADAEYPIDVQSIKEIIDTNIEDSEK